MIQEYALDPNVLTTWERFRYFVSQFGISRGRLISRYPKRWRNLVYTALEGCTDVQKTKIVERLSTMEDLMMPRTHEWKPDLEWLENAEEEHQKRPFHAIVSTSNPRSNDRVLVVDEVDNETVLWHAERERVIARRATDLASAAAPLLTLGRKLIFIDPHFDPYKPRARKTMQAFLAKAVIRQNGIQIETVEFHTKFNPDIADFKGECERQLVGLIPQGIKVTLKLWQERVNGEGLHNRYIFTERGGLRLAWGLDEGAPSETDDMSLLESGLFEQRWQQYCGDTPAFDLIESFELEGT